MKSGMPGMVSQPQQPETATVGRRDMGLCASQPGFSPPTLVLVTARPAVATLDTMSLWDSVKSFFQREAADVVEGLEGLKDKLDVELTRREAQLEATPAERLDMIRDDIESSGSPLDDIEAKLDDRLSQGQGVEEVAALDDAPDVGDGQDE